MSRPEAPINGLPPDSGWSSSPPGASPTSMIVPRLPCPHKQTWLAAAWSRQRVHFKLGGTLAFAHLPVGVRAKPQERDAVDADPDAPVLCYLYSKVDVAHDSGEHMSVLKRNMTGLVYFGVLFHLQGTWWKHP